MAYTNKTIDPRLEMPPVVELEYGDDEIDYIPQAGEVQITVPPLTGLLPPNNITVISQRLRRNRGGKDVVDLIIEVEDMPGATEYEVRVTAR